MLRRSGFTLVEVMITIAMVGVIVVPAYTFFNTSFSQYISLQREGSFFSDLNSQSQRIANVMRGVTSINTAAADSIDCYAYFSPSDAYVSRIRYYQSGGKLLADVTPMSSNPPSGSLLTNKLRTYTIIPVYYQAPGVSTFTYLDAIGNPLTLPISDLRIIKGIKVTLATNGGNLSKNNYQTMSVQVSLRNRKVNL